ncbi:MAG: hypothetical protein M9894_04820 [Planctomycetes bacterium]|nr:hypothetical protein [Planctomycetota bacterium]
MLTTTAEPAKPAPVADAAPAAPDDGARPRLCVSSRRLRARRIVALGPDARCAYCHGPFARGGEEPFSCRGCAAVLHRPCWHEARRCPTLGCRGPDVRRPPARPAEPPASVLAAFLHACALTLWAALPTAPVIGAFPPFLLGLFGGVFLWLWLAVRPRPGGWALAWSGLAAGVWFALVGSLLIFGRCC